MAERRATWEGRLGAWGHLLRPTRRVGRAAQTTPCSDLGGLGPGPLWSLSSDGGPSCVSLCVPSWVVFLQGPGLWDQSHLRASLYLNPEPS